MSEKIVYPRIYVLRRRPRSGCEYFEVRERGGEYIAFCKVLGRPLPSVSVEKCERHWEDCPFRRMAAKMEGRDWGPGGL
ncbi:hypothetical protein [Aeropyrum camini]|uniref:Uncharacterized protein n=1 Tax=Aeropyrum camini SY1 = JCM 12091 TaxID=1198449 RepID=U3TFA5_9CREN|nr:hypothetical protein [Aeropyrum camini]BAN90715.1 hypothetical protein ACAM_1246 [Aeropyrum camini SY1 = JCM 12091]